MHAFYELKQVLFFLYFGIRLSNKPKQRQLPQLQIVFQDVFGLLCGYLRFGLPMRLKPAVFIALNRCGEPQTFD
jgi:hypothetical protein